MVLILPDSNRSGIKPGTVQVDKHGKITLRYAGKLRHLGIGRAWIGTTVLVLIHDRDVTTSHAATGEILTEHTINPAKDYQPPRWRTRTPQPKATLTAPAVNPRRNA